MRLSFALTVWLLCVVQGTDAFVLPQPRATRPCRPIFAKNDDNVLDLKSQLGEARKLAGLPENYSPPQVMDAPVETIAPPEPAILEESVKAAQLSVPELPKPSFSIPELPKPSFSLPEIPKTSFSMPDFSMNSISIPKPSVRVPEFHLPEFASSPPRSPILDTALYEKIQQMKASLPPPESKAPLLSEWLIQQGAAFKQSVQSVDKEGKLALDILDPENFDRLANLKEKMAILQKNLDISVPEGLKDTAVSRTIQDSVRAVQENAAKINLEPYYLNSASKLADFSKSLDFEQSRSKLAAVTKSIGETTSKSFPVFDLSPYRGIFDFGDTKIEIPDISVKDFDLSNALKNVFSSDALKDSGIAELVSKIDWEESGPWILVAVAVLWGASQNQTAAAGTRNKQEVDLAKKMAQEAAVAAEIAAMGAREAKRMVYSADTVTNRDVLEATRRQAMQVDMDTMKQKIEKLTSEASSLKKSLAEAETKLSEFAKNTALSGEIEEKLMDFEARLASSEERAAEAEAKLEAAIAEANSTAKLRAEADKKLKTIETKLDEAEQRAAQAEANLAAAAKLAAETSALEAKIANLEAKLAAAEKKAGDAEAELAAVKVEVAPAPSTPEPAEELSVFSEIEEPVLSPTPATKKSPKKKPVNDPWASLSESAIKRKTVKELSDYLSDKGVEIKDEAGKPLKKADLLAVVMSML